MVQIKQEKRRLLIIVAGTGVGKSTLVKHLCSNFPGFKEILSTLTRPIRPGEVDGVDAIFVNKETYAEMLNNDLFLTDACPFDDHYGYQRALVDEGNVMHCIPETMEEIKEKLKNEREIITVQLTIPRNIQLARLLETRPEPEEYHIGRIAKEEARYANLEVDYTFDNSSLEDIPKTCQALFEIMRRVPVIIGT